MREIDIERLVQWAYRDELPKRGIGDVANSWDPVRGYGELLTLVDDEPGFPVIMGPPHPDALTIERAVQGLHAEVVLDWRTMRETLMGDLHLLAPRGNPMLLARAERAGVMTERVFSEIALVESCARLGRRPQWEVGTPSPQRMIGKNNRPVLVGESKGEGRYTHGSYCPLQYTGPSIEQLIVRRFEWIVWHDGLVRLAGTLRGWLLREHVAGKPDAPATPWLDAPAARPARAAAVEGVASAWPTWREPKAEPRGATQRKPGKVVPLI
jgi:hypothetical protein